MEERAVERERERERESEEGRVRRDEEREKKRYHNTDLGLSHCIENTTLYNHKSDNCFNCIYKSSCKVITKTHFNNIYKNRIYGQ